MFIRCIKRSLMFTFKLLTDNLYVLILYLVFLLGGTTSLLLLGDIVAFDLFHNVGKPFFNSFFADLTKFAEGPAMLAVFLLLAIYKDYKTAIAILAGILVAVLVTQFLKLVVFPDWHRPVIVLWNSPILTPPDFITLKAGNSFPSGHTTGAFAMYGVMAAFVFQKQFFKILFILMAIFVGYSRVFLGQHFVEDILLGSFIGLTFGSVGFMISSKYLNKFEKLNRRFLS
jgi:membrane-associated phospholipid phosphatase